MAQDNKTEKPSPQRLKKAREEGNFAVSKDFVSAFQFATFVSLLSSWTVGWFGEAKHVTRLLMDIAFRREFGPGEIMQMLRLISDHLLWPALKAGSILVVVSLAVHLAITQFGFSAKKLAPSFEKINPLKKLKNIPSQGGPAIVQAVVMLVVFGIVLYMIARDNVALFFFLPLARPEAGITKIADALMQLFWRATGLFVIFGAIDLFRQLKKHNDGLKMSKEELKEEYKQMEGNPQIKMRVRRIMRDNARRRMMSEVPKATAVIVNPTHFAVAIKYNHEDMSAPVVIAKGKNYLALRIRQKAIENQIPLIENPPLAQALYKTVDVGHEIPPHLYKAVAEILAYIYQLMNRRAAAPQRRMQPVNW